MRQPRGRSRSAKALITASLLSACASAALATAPADFSHSVPLETAPGHDVYALSLTKQVYAGVMQRDLGDLRVFDARGAEMPHALCAGEAAGEWTWIMASAGLAPHQDRSTWLFRISSLAPISRVQIGLPEPDMRLKVSIASRDADTAPWQERSSGWMRGVPDKEEREVLPAGFAAAPDRQWRVRILGGAESLRGRQLALRLGYQAQQLRFLAQGEPPYLLAYGDANAAAAQPMACADLPAESRGVATVARTMQAPNVGDQARAKPTPSPRARTLMVYGAILAAIGLLGSLLVAFALIRRRRRVTS